MVDRRKLWEEEIPPRQEAPEEYVPQTPLGQRLRQIRQEIVESGEPLLDWDGIEREVADRRGDRTIVSDVVHRYQSEELSMAKAADLAGVSWPQMREILIEKGVPPRLGPENAEEAERETQALRDFFAGRIDGRAPARRTK